MRKHLTYICLFILGAICCNSCSQNDGTIGTWFGTWVLDRIETDGHTDESYETGSTFFCFQSRVILVLKVDDSVIYEERVGTWSSTDNTLTLNFSHHDDADPNPGTARYEPPRWIHIDDLVTEMKMPRKTGREMILEHGPYTWYFRKTF